MQTLLLAAGRSRRLQPVEDKNLISFLGRPLIEHQLIALLEAGLTEITIVAGAHNIEKIRAIAEKHEVTVLEQKDLDQGMAGAVLTYEDHLQDGPLLVMNANDLVDFQALKCIQEAEQSASDGALLAVKVDSYFPGGYLTVNNGRIEGIVEKPGEGNEPSDLVNIVVHLHKNPKKLMQALHSAQTDKDDRYEVALQTLFGELHYEAIPNPGLWRTIKHPWHILDLSDLFLDGLKRNIHPSAQIAETAVIHGEVVIEEGVKIMDNAVIQGPAYIGKNTIVATGALVRNSMIGDHCVIGFSSEIARSHIGNNCWFHTNYAGDTVMGDDCSFGAGAVLANLRLDAKTIKDSGRNKLGPILGSHIRVGVNASIMPGVRIGSNTMIGSGLTIAQDIEAGKFVSGKSELKIEENRALKE